MLLKFYKLLRQLNKFEAFHIVVSMERGGLSRRIARARAVVLTILGLSAIMFIVIAALAMINEGPEKFLSTLASVNVTYFAAALACVFASTVVGFPKWSMFVSKLGVHIPVSKNFAIYQSMFSMDITPGRWGRGVVSYTLNRLTGVKFGKTFPAVVADIFTDFLGFIALSFVAAFLVHTYTIVSVVIAVLLLLPFIFIYARTPYEWIKGKLQHRKLWKKIFGVGDLYFKSSRSLDVGTYAYAMLFTIPSVALLGLALYLIIASFGIPLTLDLFPTVVFIYTSSLLLGMVTGAPGALGISDAAMIGYLVAFLTPYGLTFGIAAAVVIMFRIASMWFAEGVSSAFLMYTFRYWDTKGRIS